MNGNEETPAVTEENLMVRMNGNLKSDLQAAIRQHPSVENMSHFVEEAAKAFILQMRRGEVPAYPLEFVARSRVIVNEQAPRKSR